MPPLLTSSGCNETPNRIEFRCDSRKILSASASMPLRETNSNFSFHHKSPVSFGQPDVRLRNLHLRRPESGLTPFPEEDLSLSVYPFLPLSWRSHILQFRLEHSAPDLRISKRGMCEMAPVRRTVRDGGHSLLTRSLTCLTTSAVGFGSRSKCHPLPSFPCSGYSRS